MHVAVNAAMSVDGKLSSRRREQVAISDPEDFARVHEQRADADAVMVGIGTVLADDPSLTISDTPAENDGSPDQPARVVVDSDARTPTDAAVLDERALTYVLVAGNAPAERVATLEAAGARIVDTTGERVDLPGALSALDAQGIDRLMVEGGGEVIYSLFAADLVDELSVFVGSMIIGGRDAPTLVDGPGFVENFPALTLESVRRLDGGVLLSYRC